MLVNDVNEIPEWLNDVKKQVETRIKFQNIQSIRLPINRYRKGQSIESTHRS